MKKLCELKSNTQQAINELAKIFDELGDLFWDFLAPFYLYRNTLLSLDRNLRRHSRALGRGFEVYFTSDHKFGSILIINVRKCFFYNFFKKNNATILTSLFCALDSRWENVIKPEHYLYFKKTSNFI